MGALDATTQPDAPKAPAEVREAAITSTAGLHLYVYGSKYLAGEVMGALPLTSVEHLAGEVRATLGTIYYIYRH